MVIIIRFEISEVDLLARNGKIEVNGKLMKTPNLFPVIHPFENLITPDQLEKLGAECLFTNAFILFQNKEIQEKIISAGIHKFLNFNGIIATDSGAFQQYMYNDKIEIDAKEIESFQEKIESDLPVILDIPVQLQDDFFLAQEKIDKNITRAKENILRRTSQKANWIGPIHGGKYPELLKESAIRMSNLDFAVHAIGGLVKAFLDYRFKLVLNMLITVKKNIKHSRPLHMFGLGLPQFFSLAVACGCDLMDSAAYILYAKENRYFTLSTGTQHVDELKEFPCSCSVCSDTSPNEIRNLEPNLRIEMIAKHNLNISFSELRTIRQSIKEGTILELVDTRIRNHPNLVKAFNLIKDNSNLFELYERSYKVHGKLFSSIESIYSPIVYRYGRKLLSQYRVPSEVRFLIILPELDVRVKSSPEMQGWIKKINNSIYVDSNLISIFINSPVFGLIPFELSEIYPLSQHERIETNQLSTISYKIVYDFFCKNIDNYDLIAILFPNEYKNQFNEESQYPSQSPLSDVIDILNKMDKSKFIAFGSITSILKYIRNWIEQ